MTQMVMSRGVPQNLPDSPPSLRYGKGQIMPDDEDDMVMDTKLKIIEILQVRITRRLKENFLLLFYFLLLPLTHFCFRLLSSSSV